MKLPTGKSRHLCFPQKVPETFSEVYADISIQKTSLNQKVF